MMGIESRPKPKANVPNKALRAGADRLENMVVHQGYACTRIWGRAEQLDATDGRGAGRFDPSSDGPAGNLWAGDPVDVAHEVLEAAWPVLEEGAVADLVKALAHTVEYVGSDVLQPLPGWSWYDALVKHAPEVLQRLLDPAQPESGGGDVPQTDVAGEPIVVDPSGSFQTLNQFVNGEPGHPTPEVAAEADHERPPKPAARTDNDFMIGMGVHGLKATLPFAITSRQQAFRTAAWIKLMGDTLPDEDVASDYDEVEKAIANT